MGNVVEAWLDSLSPGDREAVDRLRRIVTGAHPGLTETIKWNAPSFADRDQDRVTLGLDRKGGTRVVLHRGVAAKNAAAFRFDDPEAVAKWPAPDRGVISMKTSAEIDARERAIAGLIRRWIEANRQA